MTLTPARRNALIVFVSLVASIALTLGMLQFGLFEREGRFTAVVKGANGEKAERELEAIVQELDELAVAAPDVEAGRQLTPAQYRQAMTNFQSTANADVLRAMTKDADDMETMADAFASGATAYQVLVDELRAITPPAAAAKLHERLTNSYVGFVAMARAMSKEDRFERIPPNDMTPYVKDRPELRELWQATAAINEAGWIHEVDISKLDPKVRDRILAQQAIIAESTGTEQVGSLRVD